MFFFRRNSQQFLLDNDTNNQQTEVLDNEINTNVTIIKRKTCFFRMLIMLAASSFFIFFHVFLKNESSIKNLNALWVMLFFTVCLPANAIFVYFWKNGKGFRKISINNLIVVIEGLSLLYALMFTFHDLTKFANRISDENLTELIAINKNCSFFNYNLLNLTSNESSSQLDCVFNLNANVNQDDLKFITHYAITSRKRLEGKISYLKKSQTICISIIIVFAYLKNVVFSGKKIKGPNRYDKFYKKIQKTLPTSTIAFGLDMNDLLDLDEENKYSYVIATFVVIALNLLFQAGFETDYKRKKPNSNLCGFYNFLFRTDAWLDLFSIILQVIPLLVLRLLLFRHQNESKHVVFGIFIAKYALESAEKINNIIYKYLDYLKKIN